MILLNPQWQGSGITDEIKIGAKTLGKFFKGCINYEVELSEGNLDIQYEILAYQGIYQQLKRFREIIQTFSPKKITTIGGDCGIEVIPVSYLNAYYNRLAIIWLDAHADLNTPISSPSKCFHGMPLRLLLGEGDKRLREILFSTIDSNQILYVGLRDSDLPEEAYITKNKIFRTSDTNYPILIKRLSEQNFDKIYIHIDLDVLDPSVYRHTMCPVKGGLQINEVEQLIENLQRDYEIVGCCITESTAGKIEQLKSIEGILKIIKDISVKKC